MVPTYTPEIKMAQIHEGVQDPKQKTVDKFHDLITEIYRVYKVNTREEIGDQVIFHYQLKQRKYYSLLDFTTKFKKFIGNSPMHTSSMQPEWTLSSDLLLFVN